MSDIKKRLQDAIELEDDGFSAIETDDTIFEDALAALHQQNQAEPVGWREAMQEFVDRCDRGEVRSTYTYNKFKALLAAAPQPKETGE